MGMGDDSGLLRRATDNGAYEMTGPAAEFDKGEFEHSHRTGTAGHSKTQHNTSCRLT